MSGLGWCLDHPDDVPARLLYADRLAEQGAPEAALYGLTAKARLTPSERTERDTLFARWGHRLRGELTELVDVHTVVLEAGFPVEAEVIRDHIRPAAVRCTHRRWRTLRRVQDDDLLRRESLRRAGVPEVRAVEPQTTRPEGPIEVLGRYDPGAYLGVDVRHRPWRVDVLPGARAPGGPWGLAPHLELAETQSLVLFSGPGPRRRVTLLPPCPGAALALASRYLEACIAAPEQALHGFALATDGELTPTCPVPAEPVMSARQVVPEFDILGFVAPEEMLAHPEATSPTFRAGRLALQMLGLRSRRVAVHIGRYHAELAEQLARVPEVLRSHLEAWLQHDARQRPEPAEALGAIRWSEADLEPLVAGLDRGGPWGSVPLESPVVVPEGAHWEAWVDRLEAAPLGRVSVTRER